MYLEGAGHSRADVFPDRSFAAVNPELVGGGILQFMPTWRSLAGKPPSPTQLELTAVVPRSSFLPEWVAPPETPDNFAASPLPPAIPPDAKRPSRLAEPFKRVALLPTSLVLVGEQRGGNV